MAYEINFKLTIEPPSKSVYEELINKNPKAYSALELEDSRTGWFFPEDEIAKFSKKHPDRLFTLDWWDEEGEKGRYYIKNGEAKQAIVTISDNPF